MNMRPEIERQISDAYSVANNRGEGYAPYADVAGDDTVCAAVDAAVDDGAEIVARLGCGIVVLRMSDGGFVGVGDASGAWAVPLPSVVFE